MLQRLFPDITLTYETHIIFTFYSELSASQSELEASDKAVLQRLFPGITITDESHIIFTIYRMI